ncbi:hypothetical protein R3I93_016870 [Phoxinus phoxinus]|uniref:Immunoglobulin domain-containing protein n=1 Tax=Phoxinus phoxinus TaxID=58324 RepID=A0AAN9CKF7_9TELE
MKTVLLFFVFYVVMNGVFGESVSVKEGDSVTLHTDLLEIQRDDVLQWRFGADGFLIAQINKGADTSSIYDGPDGRFRGRLKLDNQTGDLTITNTRTEHSGLYEVTSSRNKMFNVTVLPVDAVKSVSVLVGYSVTLNTDLIEIQRDDVIQWRFEHLNPPIAEINRKDRKISKHDGPDERFRGRLQLDYWTGSLTITHTSTKHSGFYEVDIISTSNHTIHKSFTVTVSGEVRTVSVMKGKSVTLHTGLSEIQTDDFITWMFGDIILAEIYKNQSSLDQLFYTYDGADERFRDGLQLNNQTGSLTITQSKTSNSGIYELKINSNRHLRFTLTVSGLSSGEIAGVVVGVLLLFAAIAAFVIYHCCKNSKLKHAVKSVSVMEGDSVPLNSDTELKTDDQILWTFGKKNAPIAEIKRGNNLTYDGPDERFRGRLELDPQTGSLNITHTRTEDSGPYKLQISRSGKNVFKLFNVSVSDSTALGTIPEEGHLLQPVRYCRQRSISSES